MKRKLLVLCALLMVVLSLAACQKEPRLEGRYVNSSILVENNLEFSKDGKVTYKVVTAGYVALEEAGTYTINEDKTEITLNFPGLEQSSGNLTITILDIDGTYTYTEGEGYIQIGKIKYEKVTQ